MKEKKKYTKVYYLRDMKSILRSNKEEKKERMSKNVMLEKTYNHFESTILNVAKCSRNGKFKKGSRHTLTSTRYREGRRRNFNAFESSSKYCYGKMRGNSYHRFAITLTGAY